MCNIIIIGAGTHYENAKAWILAKIGDQINMPDGTVLTLKVKNPKSAICINSNGEQINIPIKKLLPHGSDAFINYVVRDIQEQLETTYAGKPSFFDIDIIPRYNCPDTMSLARRIIRACTCSTIPKADILSYLEQRLSKSDSKLSVEQQSSAGRIAARHLLGDYPCPMHDDDMYAVAEWKAFDTWFFRHHKTKQLIVVAKTFDDLIKKRIGKKMFVTIFGPRRSKSASEMASSLKDCLHSWFMKAEDRSLSTMTDAYEHLHNRVDSQCDRMTFILEHPEIFKTETCPQQLTDLLKNSFASDLLGTLLIRVHNINFGSSMRDPIPQLSDLTSGKTSIKAINEAQQHVLEEEETRRNESARESAQAIIKVITAIENLSSTHLPYINRVLSADGCNKFTKERNSRTGVETIRINCGYRHLQLPACDMELAPMMAKQYMSVLADMVNSPKLTHTELDKAIDEAKLKTKAFLETLNETEHAA